jgi:hypothetical protein
MDTKPRLATQSLVHENRIYCAKEKLELKFFLHPAWIKYGQQNFQQDFFKISLQKGTKKKKMKMKTPTTAFKEHPPLQD